MDRDGFISNGELFLVLKMMVGSNLKVRPYARSSVEVWITRYTERRLSRFLGCPTAADRRQDDHGGGQGRVRSLRKLAFMLRELAG